MKRLNFSFSMLDWYGIFTYGWAIGFLGGLTYNWLTGLLIGVFGLAGLIAFTVGLFINKRQR